MNALIVSKKYFFFFRWKNARLHELLNVYEPKSSFYNETSINDEYVKIESMKFALKPKTFNFDNKYP